MIWLSLKICLSLIIILILSYDINRIKGSYTTSYTSKLPDNTALNGINNSFLSLSHPSTRCRQDLDMLL